MLEPPPIDGMEQQVVHVLYENNELVEYTREDLATSPGPFQFHVKCLSCPDECLCPHRHYDRIGVPRLCVQPEPQVDQASKAQGGGGDGVGGDAVAGTSVPVRAYAHCCASCK